MKHRLHTLLMAFGLIVLSLTSACAQSPEERYPFPALPYAFDALEPAIDAQTMQVHYNKHHKGYYAKFLKAVVEAEKSDLSMPELFAQASSLPTALRNNAGGYYNHCLFWENLTPNPSPQMPTRIKKLLEDSFGSIDKFKAEFEQQAASVFGSGWAWLVVTPNAEFKICTTANQDNPLMDDAPLQGTPLLALDVWEHAYYLQYQNQRASYIAAFWSIVNWEVVEERLQKTKK
ncbi:MAG: superoxide dismutase [Mangrovibacterium sp.]